MRVQEDVFGAIASPARRAILARLAQGETPVRELAESFEMTLSAVSQHLGVLREAGLVATRRHGRQRIYRLNPEPLNSVSEWLRELESFWKDRLAALGDFLEENDEDRS